MSPPNTICSPSNLLPSTNLQVENSQSLLLRRSRSADQRPIRQSIYRRGLLWACFLKNLQEVEGPSSEFLSVSLLHEKPLPMDAKSYENPPSGQDAGCGTFKVKILGGSANHLWVKMTHSGFSKHNEEEQPRHPRVCTWVRLRVESASR